MLSKGGFEYIFELSPELLNQKDWRSDGYRWIQGATLSVASKSELTCKKYYFKSQIKKGNNSTDSFQRRAIECSKFPHRVLIRYLDDESCSVFYNIQPSFDLFPTSLLPFSATSASLSRTNL